MPSLLNVVKFIANSQISLTVLELLKNAELFSDLDILPARSLIDQPNARQKCVFTIAEDGLLAMGLEEFGRKFDSINEYLMPVKMPRQLRIHLKNVRSTASNFTEANPLKYYSIHDELKDVRYLNYLNKSNSVKEYMLKKEGKIRFVQIKSKSSDKKTAIVKPNNAKPTSPIIKVSPLKQVSPILKKYNLIKQKSQKHSSPYKPILPNITAETLMIVPGRKSGARRKLLPKLEGEKQATVLPKISPLVPALESALKLGQVLDMIDSSDSELDINSTNYGHNDDFDTESSDISDGDDTNLFTASSSTISDAGDNNEGESDDISDSNNNSNVPSEPRDSTPDSTDVSNKEMKTNSELPVLQTAVTCQTPNKVKFLPKNNIEVLPFVTESESQSDSEDVAEEDNLDKEVDLVELMAASSRICSKRAKSLKRSKQQREVESSLALLEHPSNSYGRQNQNKAHVFAQAYLNRVYETLCQSQDLDRYEKFLKLLSDFRIGDSMSTVMLFKTVKTLFAQHEHLVDEFVGFLLPEEALECGVHFSKNPQYLQKILRVLSQFQSQTDFTSSDLKSAVVPLLRGQAHLIDEFLSLIPDLQPPESLMTDFEEINLSDQEVNSDEDFELLTLPETQDKYGTKECPCVCHTNTHTTRYINRIAHCASCGTKFIDGRVYLQVGKLLKPAKITYHSAINSTKCKNLTSPVLNSETPANETSSTSRTVTESKLATDDMKAKLTVENQKDSISPPSSSSSSVSHSKETSKRRNFNLNTKNGTNIAATTPLKVDTCDTSFQSVMSSPPTDKVQFQIPNVNDSDNVTLSSSGKLQDFSRIFNSDQNKPALNVKITNTSNLTSSKLFPQTKMVTRNVETIASKVQILPTELCNNKSMKEMLCKDTDNSTSSEDLKGANTLQINKRKSASTEVCESTKKQKSASEVCVTDSSSSSSTSNSLISSDVWSKEDDRTLLLKCKELGAALETFQIISEKLSNKTPSQVKIRFETLMKLLSSENFNSDSSETPEGSL
ncbi:GON-4-like protein [Nymphon striatum]|nr:GON-4-like protein [Nymphon striatum]